MKILFVCILAIILCVVAASATVVSNNKLMMALPKSLNKDSSIVNLPQKVGLPFGDFSSKSASELQAIFRAEFPILYTNSSKSLASFSFADKKMNVALHVEAIRFAILENALRFRNQEGDKAALRVMLGDWKCEACIWCVTRLESFLTSHGCSDASDYIGELCAKIPYVGPWTVSECQKVLDWGCEKLVALIERHITQPNQLCDDVFGLSC